MAGHGRHLLLVSLLLLAGLAGCVGNPGAGAPSGSGDEAAPEEGAPGGVVHFGVPATRLSGSEADGGDLQYARAEGVVGMSRGSGKDSFEPTLGVLSDGSIVFGHLNYNFGDDLVGIATGVVDLTLLQKTSDQGLTWTDVTPKVAGTRASYPPNTNDPYVWVDPETDRVFLIDIQMLACNTMSYSDDGAATWTPSLVPCGIPPGGQDHQTIWTAKPRTVTTTGYPNVLHYCVNRVVDTACAQSLDGGRTFGVLTPLVFKSVEPRTPIRACGGLMHHGTAAPDGTVYLGKGHCGVPSVAKSVDDGKTWTVHAVSTTVPMAQDAKSATDVGVAVDEAGNVYAFWIGTGRKPYLAVSTDAGETWGTPIMVAPPTVKAADFASIAAGADGRIAFSYIGTDQAKAYAAMPANATWHGYIGVTTDALSPSPTITTVAVNDPSDPIARGKCGGSRCGESGGNSNTDSGMGDFLDLVIDHEGRPWAAFVDVCYDACAGNPTATNANFGRALLGTLAEGPRLRGPAGTLPSLV